MLKNKLICLLVCLVYSLHAGVEYDIICLQSEGIAPGSSSCAEDLNENGYVLVSYHKDYNSHEAYIYHPSIGYELLFELSGDQNYSVDRINNQGIIVGKDYNVAAGQPIFIYDNEKTYLIDKSGVWFKGITDDGKILIYDYINNNNYIYDVNVFVGEFICFLSDEKLVNMGSLDPHARWGVEGEVINNQGTIAGVGNNIHEDQIGFLWDEHKGLRAINNELGGNEVYVSAINNLSQIVGKQDTENLDRHAFLFDESFGTVDLGTLGGLESEAFSINDKTQIVGISDSTKAKGERAFIWDKEHGMRDLTDLIPKDSGWKKLVGAIKINNKGFIIGQGKYKGQTRGFLLIPRALTGLYMDKK